jgi:mitogen-activated protein kinase 7
MLCTPRATLASTCLVTYHHPLQVEDPLPPVFSGTPKGSGAGYGVGFDLEEFLNQSFDMGVADGPQDG